MDGPRPPDVVARATPVYADACCHYVHTQMFCLREGIGGLNSESGKMNMKSLTSRHRPV